MIPSIPHEFDVRSMEDIMFEALEKNLPKEYYVFHSFKILTIKRGIFRESETDFVIFHPNKGILCLEAKAGIPSYHDGEWYYQSGKIMKNGGPYRQALNNLHKLVDYMNDHDMAGIVSNCKFVSGVWFPSVTKNDLDKIHFPIDSEKDLTLTHENLDYTKSGIDRLFSIDVNNARLETHLEDYQIRKLFDDVLCPSFDIVPSMRAKNSFQKKIFNRLLKEQSKILNYLEDQPSAIINGVAGSGKTMIAVEKARRDTQDGSKVLFLCFNRYLKDFLKKEYNYPNVDFYTLDGYSCKICNSSTPDLKKANQVIEEQFYNGLFPYKHIVIDEGQDFGQDRIEESNLIETLRMIVLDETIDGSFYIFYDKLQLIQAKAIPSYIQDADCKLTLYKNCRNTENISKTSMRPFPDVKKPKLYENAEEGTVPKMYVLDDPDKTEAVVNKCIRQCVADSMENIVILTCSPRIENSCLYPFTSDNEYSIGSKKYLFTTVRRYKGLEADAVILIDIEEETLKKNDAKLFYVGASRARLQLMMVANLSEQDCTNILQTYNTKSGKRARKSLATFLGAMYIKE